jgi:hypothetical protein
MQNVVCDSCKREGPMIDFNEVIGVEHFYNPDTKNMDSKPIYAVGLDLCSPCFTKISRTYNQKTPKFQPIIRGTR